MGDSSLDEFFAKKDKSKRNKSKTKFTTSDLIAKKLEEGVKKEFPKKDVKEKTNLSTSNPSANTPNLSEQDDEWKNIEDEKERDYSGLRIQALSIIEKEKEEEHLKEQMVDQNGEMCKVSEGQSGPWKKMTSVHSPAPAEERVEKPAEPEVAVSSSKPMAYKPPALRHSPASNSSNNSSSSRRPTKSAAPQITSEIHFPTLSSAVDSKGKCGASDVDRSFQSVKHGIKSKNESQHELHLDLENKFSALHHGD